MSATVKEVPLITREAFISAMESCVTGVQIVATDGPAGREGATLSGMTAISTEPGMLMICLNRASSLCSAIEENRGFSVNVLAEGQKMAAHAFSTFAQGEPRFADPHWTISPEGTPLLQGAIASFDCRLHQQLAVNDKVLLVGEVSAVYRHYGVPLARQARQYVLIQRDQY